MKMVVARNSERYLKTVISQGFEEVIWSFLSRPFKFIHMCLFFWLKNKDYFLFPVNCTIATIFSCYQIKHCWWLFSQKMQKEVPINNKNSNEVMWGGSSFFRSSVIFLVQRQHLQQSASLGNLLAKTNSFFFLLY